MNNPYGKCRKAKRVSKIFSEITCRECEKEIVLGESYFYRSSGYEWCEECYNKAGVLLQEKTDEEQTQIA